MTSYQEVRSAVENSSYTDWIRFPNLGVWTFQDDVSLRISRTEQLGPCQQPWTNQFQAQSTRYGYVVYYHDSPVEYHTVVGIDNDRAFVPEPQQPQTPGGSFSITPYQAVVGEIITGDPGTVESYCNRANIAIQE